MLDTYAAYESDAGPSVLAYINHVSGMSVESDCLTSAVSL